MNGGQIGSVRAQRHRVGSGEIAEVVLDRQFIALAADPRVLSVVLSSASDRAFCAGADLNERAAMSDAEIMAQRPVFRAAFGALLALPQPAIAAVGGFALGGGCELALSCDIIVADG